MKNATQAIVADPIFCPHESVRVSAISADLSFRCADCTEIITRVPRRVGA